jgi:hypothetical protein
MALGTRNVSFVMDNLSQSELDTAKASLLNAISKIDAYKGASS